MPAQLVSVVIVTGVVLAFAITVPTVGDQGELPRSLPSLFIATVLLTWETVSIIARFALGVALVGLMESLLTAKLVDEITDTHSRKGRDAWAQGVSNVLSGIFDGMGGCAVIGQTMINVKASEARTRISTFAVRVVRWVLVASVLFVRFEAHFVRVKQTLSDEVNTVAYAVTGELFLATSNGLTTLFSHSNDPTGRARTCGMYRPSQRSMRLSGAPSAGGCCGSPSLFDGAVGPVGFRYGHRRAVVRG